MVKDQYTIDVLQFILDVLFWLWMWAVSLFWLWIWAVSKESKK